MRLAEVQARGMGRQSIAGVWRWGWGCALELLDTGDEPVALGAGPGVLDVPDLVELFGGGLLFLADQAREADAGHGQVAIPLEGEELRLEPHHLKLSARPRPDAELTIGQRVDECLNGNLPESGIPFEDLIERLERALILRASYATNWNQSKTAEFLNLKRDKLRYRMKLYQIHGPKERSEAPAE